MKATYLPLISSTFEHDMKNLLYLLKTDSETP